MCDQVVVYDPHGHGSMGRLEESVKRKTVSEGIRARAKRPFLTLGIRPGGGGSVW